MMEGPTYDGRDLQSAVKIRGTAIPVRPHKLVGPVAHHMRLCIRFLGLIDLRAVTLCKIIIGYVCLEAGPLSGPYLDGTALGDDLLCFLYHILLICSYKLESACREVELIGASPPIIKHLTLVLALGQNFTTVKNRPIVG